MLVESLTPGVPITVEYARTSRPASFGDGGGAALATRIHQRWFDALRLGGYVSCVTV